MQISRDVNGKFPLFQLIIKKIFDTIKMGLHFSNSFAILLNNVIN